MLKKFNFRNLFVLDLANNHQGDISHAKNIIKNCSLIAKENDIYAGIKFQFRNLPNFIHLDEQKNPQNKHVPRFLSTKLDWMEYSELVQNVKEEGLVTICTPFDEESVDQIILMGFDVIKIASCSAADWPLLEKVADTGLPIIASTGGLHFEQIDNLVSFFKHKACDFALMHCVSIYPTPNTACNINNISELKERYPDVVIGWSTHENPEDMIPVGLALASGAEMFERHVGMETKDIKLNAYSSTPEILNRWFKSYIYAKSTLGSRYRDNILPEEKDALQGLARGVFLKKPVKSGKEILIDNVYFAFPIREGQLSSGLWKKGIVAKENMGQDEPVNISSVKLPDETAELVIKKAIHKIKAMLSYARVPLTHEFTTEYSHHYGIKNFTKVGVVLINILNREYAKKILIQLPNQEHPLHYHKLKEETFIVLWGELISNLDGRERVLKPGDYLTVLPGVWHSFKTTTGCVFEEISTTAFADDSVYKDPKIAKLTSSQRKTIVDHWGRFQIKEQLIG